MAAGNHNVHMATANHNVHMSTGNHNAPSARVCHNNNRVGQMVLSLPTTSRTCYNNLGYGNKVESGSLFGIANQLDGHERIDDDNDDDEIISDDFSADELQEIEQFQRAESSSRVENADDSVTKQLIQFAELVNSDIQRYFGKNRGQEDSCDIYEDKWPKSKSGRELYYADLLKIAQGLDDDDDKQTGCHGDTNDNSEHTGRADVTSGLGPFQELFDHLQTGTTNDVENDSTSEVAQNQTKLPMHARKLPVSFFDEPKHNRNGACLTNVVESNKSTALALPSCSKAPDFSDLLEYWTGEESAAAEPATVEG